MEEKSDYLTVSDFLVKLENLNKDDHHRLVAIANRLCRFYGIAASPSELVHEAIARILDDSRHVPESMNVVASMASIMKSIAEGWNERRFASREKSFTSQGWDSIEDADVSAVVSGPEDELVAEQTLAELEARFENDGLARSLMTAVAFGFKKDEIIESIFKGDAKTYEATRKRFRRGILRLREEGVAA